MTNYWWIKLSDPISLANRPLNKNMEATKPETLMNIPEDQIKIPSSITWNQLKVLAEVALEKIAAVYRCVVFFVIFETWK